MIVSTQKMQVLFARVSRDVYSIEICFSDNTAYLSDCNRVNHILSFRSNFKPFNVNGVHGMLASVPILVMAG